MKVVKAMVMIGIVLLIVGVLMIGMSGCATCERHPVVCAAAVTVAGTSIALSASGGHHDPSQEGYVMHAPISPGAH